MFNEISIQVNCNHGTDDTMTAENHHLKTLTTVSCFIVLIDYALPIALLVTYIQKSLT